MGSVGDECIGVAPLLLGRYKLLDLSVSLLSRSIGPITRPALVEVDVRRLHCKSAAGSRRREGVLPNQKLKKTLTLTLSRPTGEGTVAHDLD